MATPNRFFLNGFSTTKKRVLPSSGDAREKCGVHNWIALKHILKYLRRTRDYMLIYSSGSLKTIGYTDSDFQGDIDSRTEEN